MTLILFIHFMWTMFCWNYDGERFWTGVALGRFVRLEWDGEVCIFYDMDEQEFVDKWVNYFDLNTDYSSIKDLPKRMNT